MVDGNRMREFWSHWQHEPNTTEELKRFRIRMTEVCRKLWDDYFIGNAQKWRRRDSQSSRGTPYSFSEHFPQSGLNALLEQAKSVFEVASAVQHFLWAAEESVGSNFDLFAAQYGSLRSSPVIMIRLVRHGNTATIYPMGVKMLDEGVVYC